MRRFSVRRLRNLAILIGLAAAIVYSDGLLRMTLRDAARTSGWLLISMVLFLAAYNLFKKFPYFPLGTSAAWLQLHIYTGLLSGVVFALHIGPRVPGGVFGFVLAALYVSVALSGVFGLVVSRMFARRLTARGGEILFERIPRSLGVRRRAAQRMVRRCLDETHSTLLPEFYAERLEPFFAAHRNLGHHLIHSSRPHQAMLAEIHAQRRYLSEAEAVYLAEVEELVARKDDLDYQYAHQAVLRYWLFIHVPLTYALLVFALFHLVLVHAF